MVAPTSVSNDFDTVQSIIDVGILRYPELFASLTRYGCVVASDHSIAEDSLTLSNNLSNALIKLE